MAENSAGSCPDEGKDDSKEGMDLDALGIAAMWFAGFNTFQPLNICRSGSSFLLQRFGFPVQKTGVFVGETNASVNYFVFWGTLSAMLLTNLTRMVETDWSKNITPVLSIISSVVIVFINFQILHVYRSHFGCVGVRKIYYWMSLAGLAYSFDMTVTRNITPDKSVDWSFGENFANGFISLLHWFIRTMLKCFRVPSEQHHYYLMFWHITFVVGLSIFTLLLWLFHLWKNVFTGGTKSELADAIKWLLMLKQTLENGSTANGDTNQPDKWQSYLDGDGQNTQSKCSKSRDNNKVANFKEYFSKLKELNQTLKDIACTQEYAGTFSQTPENLRDSRYQLRSYVETVLNKTEKFKKIANKISTSDLDVCVTLKNGGQSTGDEICCCTGKLSVFNQYEVTISGLKGTLTDCVNNCLCGTTVKLCACLETSMIFKYSDKTTTTAVTVKVASGMLCLSSSGDTFSISSLTCTSLGDSVCSGKLQSIYVSGLRGTMEGCDVTSLKVALVLDFGKAGTQVNVVCKAGTGGTNTATSITLQSGSYITISGIVKTVSGQKGKDSGVVQTCEAFSFSSYNLKENVEGLYYGLLLIYENHGEKANETNVKVVATSMFISTTIFNGKISICKALAVAITDCSIKSGTNGVIIQKICPVDADQRKHYEDFRDELKDLFPGKGPQIYKKLNAGGVCKDISDACCCSPTKTIIINTSESNVCLYKVHKVKEKLRDVSGKQSKHCHVKAFIESKTKDVTVGYGASLGRGASPASMTITGTIILFFIYPSVSPYLMVAERHTYFTSLILLFISSLGPFVPWILGHKKLRRRTYFKQYWIKDAGGYQWLWVLFPPAMIIFLMFLVILHYPNFYLSKAIRYQWPAIIFCSTYHLCLYILRPIGSGGTYSNAAGEMVEKKLRSQKEENEKGMDDAFSYAADKENGKATMTMVVSFRYSIMVVSILIGQSYASSYRSYKTGDQSDLPWPTANMNAMGSCYWWTRLSLHKANHRFWHIRDTDIAALIK